MVMDYLNKIMEYFEIHSVEGIKTCFENGISPNEMIKGKPLIYELINMYTRGPKFKDCIRISLDYGLEFEDKTLLAILLDDAHQLEKIIAKDKSVIDNKYSLDSTFAPLFEASLLHLCAEYNHVSCAEILLQNGADVNSRAGIDKNGFGGQTPIFHTVNKDANKCLEMMNLLIACDADLSITIKGLIWGKGYDWETFIPAVNPISYAMMGLLRQFQRNEKDIYEIVTTLLKASFGCDYIPANVPNKYLNT